MMQNLVSLDRGLIEVQQQNILSKDVLSTGIICYPERSERSLLTEVLDYDEEILRMALGEFGVRLRDFAYVVDLDHPDIRSSALFDPEFTERFSKLLRLVCLAKEHGLQDCLDGLSKLHVKSLPTHLKFLDTPFKNQQYVRFLPSRDDRERIRSTKGVSDIELCAFYKKGRSGWEQTPNDFAYYIRNNKSYKEEIDKASKKAERYASLGCQSMAQKIMESIEGFRSVMEDMHYGFHRITMTNAAVILAKMHQFDFCGLLEKGQLFDTDNYRIFVPKDVHGGESEFYQYSPRAYPLNELKELAPTRVLEIIERLEMFDEANGKAIFDHYVVIVPGYRIEKNTRSVQEMDTTLIQRQAVTPIVLGERDGKCYFICYWI